MQILDLPELKDTRQLTSDIVIVGGGPAGLTIAREFFNHRAEVLVVESGLLEPSPDISALSNIESIGEPRSPAQLRRRAAYHGANASSWSPDEQPFGVRCRMLGGSTHAWAGKSASFEALDFEARPWVAHSGWPITLGELQPAIDRAAEHLNLGPNVYDDRIWEIVGKTPPEPALDPNGLRDCFWQFARSRIDPVDVMRFGPEFRRETARNVRVLLNATATRILTDETGKCAVGIEVAALNGTRIFIASSVVVLAASAIENARLLLASNQVQKAGLGNHHDVVGRFLLDHQGVRVAHFGRDDVVRINKRFGFQGVGERGRTHLYMHGLTLAHAVLEREGLLNCAVYMMEERAPDDPLEAIKRLMKRSSSTPLADLLAVVKSPAMAARGIAIKALQSRMAPPWLERAIVEAAIRINPDFVVREHLDRGLPHKLLGLSVEGISEQRPDPESRITLSNRSDPLGVPLAKVHWKLDQLARTSLARLGDLMVLELKRVGLPAPVLEEWVTNEHVEAPMIDMAHTMGTTRMSDDPRTGVVDRHCRVHGVSGLYVAGGSVFPTAGHANPTLMILALAVRLADHLKARVRQYIAA